MFREQCNLIHRLQVPHKPSRANNKEYIAYVLFFLMAKDYISNILPVLWSNQMHVQRHIYAQKM